MELRQVRALARDNAEAAIAVLVDMMGDGHKDQDRFKAAREVLLWAFGRPEMLVMVEDGVGLDEADAQQRVAILAAALKKAQAEAEQVGVMQ